jgi:ABC-type bacteriocin/lantibiotic exporter with double-glycine peptidase domain
LIEALEEDDESVNILSNFLKKIFQFKPLLTAIPYVISFLMVILVLWGGAYVFQLIDEVAAEKPLYNVMFYTLQVVCIVGMFEAKAMVFCC